MDQDNRYNIQEGKEEFKRNYREIFGGKTPEPGCWIWVGGTWIKKENYRKERKAKAPYARVFDHTAEVEVHRAAKRVSETGQRIHTEKIYRDLA